MNYVNFQKKFLNQKNKKGGAASYELWPVFSYSNGYWEVYRRFQGDFFLFREESWGGGGTWEDISMEKLLMGEENSMKGAGFSSIIWKTMKK